MPAAESVRHATVFDDDTRHLARVYAEALLEGAGRDGGAAVVEELEALVQQVLDAAPVLEHLLGSAAVGRERKEGLLRHAFQGRVSDCLFRFLLVLNHHQRLGILRQITETARDVFERRSGRLEVEVQSAVPLVEDQQDRLRQQLRHSLQREPVLRLQVDPDLLGGLLVRVGDRVYDATLRGRLQNLQTRLLERR
jgi:F-type H+-transporting ATPase subunit delta